MVSFTMWMGFPQNELTLVNHMGWDIMIIHHTSVTLSGWHFCNAYDTKLLWNPSYSEVTATSWGNFFLKSCKWEAAMFQIKTSLNFIMLIIPDAFYCNLNAFFLCSHLLTFSSKYLSM